MLILGIDPGLNITGYGFIETNKNGFCIKQSGFIKTGVKEGMPKRLSKIHATLSSLIDQYRPDCLVLEKIYSHYKHPITAALLGHARGVICMLSEEKHIPFFEYAATSVKKTITGSGHASKLQIQKMVEHMANAGKESLGPMDTTDAISLALAHAYITRSRI